MPFIKPRIGPMVFMLISFIVGLIVISRGVNSINFDWQYILGGTAIVLVLPWIIAIYCKRNP